MTSASFQQLKQRSSDSFHQIRAALMKQRLLPNQRMTMSVLSRILRSACREDLIDKTLLSDWIWSKHQDLMMSRFDRMIHRIQAKHQKHEQMLMTLNKSQSFNYPSYDFETYCRSRLRFVTILHSVVFLDLNQMLDAATDLEKQLHLALVGEFPSVRLVGAIEFEFINLDLLRKASFDHDGRHSGKRKRETLLDMLGPILFASTEFCVLVHFHGVMDLGPGDTDITKEKLDQRLRSFSSCWTKPNQIQIKQLSQHVSGTRKTVKRNLQDIARYITKGSNFVQGKHRYFKYKVAFDQEDSGFALDATFVAEGSEDARNMPFEQIVLCADVLNRLMDRRRQRDGYVVTI